MKIAILGGKGMLGSDLVKFLGDKHETFAISKDNYDEFHGKEFDVLINANGNSRRFWANEHPFEDFESSTVSVAKSLFDFRCKKYVYISSPDVYEDPTNPATTREDSPVNMNVLSPYGFHRRLSEELVKHYADDFIILRSSAILGAQLKKGIACDVLEGRELFVTLDSKIQFITTRALSEVIDVLLSKNASRDIFNVGGRGTVTPDVIGTLFRQQVRVRDDAKQQQYEMSTEKIRGVYGALKTSKEYIGALVKTQ